MRKALKLAAVALALLLPALAHAQGSYYNKPIVNSAGRPVGGALVAICQIAATIGTSTTPCSPLASIYLDQGLTMQDLTNGVSKKTDGLGNLTFWAPAGAYQIQVYGPSVNVTMYADVVGCIPSAVGCSATTAYVYPGNPEYWAGSDACGWINSAIASLPLTGGTVIVGPGNYNVTTQCAINKANVTVQGSGSSFNSDPAATQITWTGGASAVWLLNAPNATLRAFGLNNTGTATVGVSINGNSVNYKILLDNFSITFPTVQFSVAGIQTTTAGTTSWLTLRDSWIQKAAPIGADIVYTDNFVSDHSTFWGNNTNIRVGAGGDTVYSFQFVNGSDSETYSWNGNGAIGLDLIALASFNIENSYFESNGDAMPGQTGQLAIKFDGSAIYGRIVGNYMTGNGETNYAIKIANTAQVLTFNNDTFLNWLTAGIDNTAGSGTLIKVDQNSIPLATPLVISGLVGVNFYEDTSGLMRPAIFGQVAAADFAGVSACSGNTKAISLPYTYANQPAIFVFDESTKGGANLSAKSTSGFTVSCTGAADVFDWFVVGNPN